LDWFSRGGILMLPIIVLSVIALTVFLERLWVLRKSQILPQEALKKFETLLRKNKVLEARQACHQMGSPIARILLAALQHPEAPRAIMKENMEERGKAEALELKKHLGLLQTIASICPLIGLLGTVSGMIKVFDTLALEGAGNPAAFAGGISVALITTATGLSVAIPAFLCHRYLVIRAELFIHMLEEFATYLLNLIPENKSGAGREEQ